MALNSASTPNRKKESDGEFSGKRIKSFWNVLSLFMVAIKVYRWIQKRIEKSNVYMAFEFVFAM